MLLEFGFKNFFSFREGATISFRLDANCPKSVSRGRDFSTVLAVKGANASGKTQVLKALSFLEHFATRSFGLEPDATIPLSTFFDSPDPAEFYAEFRLEDVVYTYELACTDAEVKRETIFRRKSRRSKVFERIGSEIVHTGRGFEGLEQVKLRANASIVSTAHQYELPELQPVYDFFRRVVTNVGYGGMREEPWDIGNISKLLHANPEALSFVNEFIRECDAGVQEVYIRSTKDAEGKEEFYPIFLHINDGKKHPITEYTESSGTKALLRVLPLYKAVVDAGGVLALDEFDVHLHPHILPKLLQLFLDSKRNPKNAQLLFTTHDGEILDSLGRYRTYLVNKTENESFVYRLDEIPGDILRNDRPILPIYRAGKIGGVPRV